MSVNDLVYLSNEGFHENYLAVAKCTGMYGSVETYSWNADMVSYTLFLDAGLAHE